MPTPSPYNTAPVLTTTGRTSVDGLRPAYWLDCDIGFSWGHSLDAPEFIAAGAVIGLYSDGSPMGAAWWRDHAFRAAA